MSQCTQRLSGKVGNPASLGISVSAMIIQLYGSRLRSLLSLSLGIWQPNPNHNSNPNPTLSLSRNMAGEWEVEIHSQQSDVSDEGTLKRISEKKGPKMAILGALNAIDGLAIPEVTVAIESVIGAEVSHGSLVPPNALPPWFKASLVRVIWSAGGGCMAGELRCILVKEGPSWRAEIREMNVRQCDQGKAVKLAMGHPGLLSAVKDALTLTLTLTLIQASSLP